jgi:CRISPR-associated helicase Cas3/CRISPR-associated endonuclease Cas3-HD
MLSACTREFLSHPIEDKKHSLIEHLLEVAKKSNELFLQTNFSNTSLAFYSGLLHDVGKINPFYQEIFHETKNRKKVEEKILEKYVQEHSRFSARIVDILLQKSGLDYDVIEKIMVLIYGHHSKIRKNLGKISKGEKFLSTQKAIASALYDFSTQISKESTFSKLNWESCKEKFSRPIEFDVTLKSKNSPDDYLELSCAFSCLLQADRGSFSPWSVPNFDLKLETTSLITDSPLGKIRTEFQQQVMDNFDENDGISIINAPTGIGKTKVFLDIIHQYSNKNVERIFYFSPLLALTEDFETKISSVIPKNQQNDILVYNHLFSGSLQDKRKEEGRITNKWIFENESFNKKFVITTTQRLLMTLYSNSSRDKMKFSSFKNSVLIIDEVQTIPKPILSNLKEIFKKMYQFMGTRVILVSATIPNEISDIKRVELSDDTLNNYLSMTKKQILIQTLDIQNIPVKKTLVMANTRKKAVQLFFEINQAHPRKKIIYISTGIRKLDRIKIIKKLPEQSEYILVATQVVEAGVDISFSHVYREQAPLDNIIQVMGRLNREGKNPNAQLVVYPTDGNPIPYSPLEFQVTQQKIANVTNSTQIYGILEQYYEEISARNQRNIQDTELLERRIADMDFDGVWKFIRNMVFQQDDRDTVFIPDEDDWEDVKNGLLYGITRDNFKKFGKLTASLPVSLDKVGLEYFDEELMEKNILLPKKEYLRTIYDENTGLDSWLME